MINEAIILLGSHNVKTGTLNMTEIYLIRHTEAEGNLYKVMQGFWDGDVTALGLKEAEALAERFRDVHLDAVYSSDLYRARLTAAAVAKYNDAPVITDMRLREINVGPLEGTFFGNTIHDSPDSMRMFLEHPWEWRLEGAETLDDVADRACRAFTEIAGERDGQTIAVVSHGMTVRCLLTRLLGLPEEGVNAAPIVKNTAVSKLLFDGGRITAAYINDASHLSGLEVTDWVQKNLIRHEPFDPASDKRYYIDCYRDAWSFAHRGDTKHFFPEQYYLSSLSHSRANPCSVLKLYYEDEPAGLLDMDTLRGSEEGYGWISLIYLSEDFRYKRFGIQALGRAIMLYHSLGRKAIRLNVAADNETAVHFYEKYGFRIISSSPGADGPLYLMERTLGRISSEYI